MQLSELIKKDPVIERVAKAEEVIWFNPGLRCRDAAFEGISLTMADIDDAEARLRRFAPFIMLCFPETAGNGGIIESPLTEVEHMRQRLNGHGGGIGGRLLLKRDSDLAIAGSVKARGGIYEILKHTEEIALEKGLLSGYDDDYAKLAGLTAEEDLKEPLKESMKKRLPWLIILLGLGMVVSSVVGIFEKVVTALPIIMCFQSLILDMAGNVGTQSLAVTIRVLMDESLTGKQKLELVWKEMRIGLCNGGLLGILSFALIGLYIYLFKGKTLLFSYAVSGCIGVALLLAMLISSAVGTCIPLFFKKINIDPAVASGPLITTVNDLVAVITYYGLSWLFLLKMLNLAG